MTVNYYVFDRIEKDDQGYLGYLGDNSCEVFSLEGDDTELIEAGFAKCDAPDTETFCVEETAWAAIAATNPSDD